MIELFFIPAGIPDDLDRNRPVIILDIFRASTSMTAALAAGAKEIRVASSMTEAFGYRNHFGGTALIAGERDGLKREGYDLGNSPFEMTAETVSGKTIIFDSTNGSKLVRKFETFHHVAVGSLVSFGATLDFVRGFAAEPIIACAGRVGTFSGEDALAAGLLLIQLRTRDEVLDDAALFARRLAERAGEEWKTWAANSYHGRYLRSLGWSADVEFCLTTDRYEFVPVLEGDRLVHDPRSGKRP
jgi:2-phosphosulfolactate phosphatase